jgi:uncharacterized membrane protein
MDIYFVVKTLHILSATILFGTGIGIAFFMLLSWWEKDIAAKLYAARVTVLMDAIFTAPAVIIQPLTGVWLMWKGGYDPSASWLVWTYALYLVAGLCWLPVVWIQIRLKTIVKAAHEAGTPLPVAHDRLFKIWFMLGIPAFVGLVGVFFLMVGKPG